MLFDTPHHLPVQFTSFINSRGFILPYKEASFFLPFCMSIREFEKVQLSRAKNGGYAPSLLFQKAHGKSYVLDLADCIQKLCCSHSQKQDVGTVMLKFLCYITAIQGTEEQSCVTM